jgi:hypothetical protein
MMPLVNPRSLLRILCIGFAISLTVAAEPSVSPAEITIESPNGSLTLVCRTTRDLAIRRRGRPLPPLLLGDQ